MTAKILYRMASPRPASVNEEAKTVELVIATESDVGDGIVLSCREVPDHGPAPVPVLLSHQNHTGAMAGRIRSLRVENRQVIGLAEFTNAPAAEAGWSLASAGCAISVGARFDPDALQRQAQGADIATRWRLNEASLVPVGADPLARTRSFSSEPMTVQSTAQTPPIDQTPPAGESTVDSTITRAELTRQKEITRSVLRAGLPADLADELIASNEPLVRCQERIFEVMRGQLSQANTGRPVAHAVPGGSGTAEPGLADILAARFGVGKAEHKNIPLARAMESIARRDGLDIMMSSPARVIERAFSTSDFAISLLDASERTVLNGYTTAPEGIRALAMRRTLDDFREVTALRLSKFGSLAKKPEGGEYTSLPWDEEEAGVLKADEYGRIVALTRKALINDNLDIFGRLLMEMGASAARLEAEMLADVLLNDFTWVAANTATATTASGVAGALVSGTLKLRRQTDISGAKVSFEPRVLLVPPELEADALQVLSDRYMPTDSSDVNPFRVTLAVDAQLTATNVCYLADVAHPPMALGTIGTPVTSREEHFDSGNIRLRVQHDAAAAVMDERSICRITIS